MNFFNRSTITPPPRLKDNGRFTAFFKQFKLTNRFRKGVPRFMNCLSARFSAGREKDGRSGLFSRLNEMFSTAGAGTRGMRPGRESYTLRPFS